MTFSSPNEMHIELNSFLLFYTRLEYNACPYSFKQTQMKTKTSQRDVLGLTISFKDSSGSWHLFTLYSLWPVLLLEVIFQNPDLPLRLIALPSLPLFINRVSQLGRKPPSNRAPLSSSVEFWSGTKGYPHWADPWCAHVHVGVTLHHGPSLLTVCRFLGIPPLGQGVLFFSWLS